ncbi:Mitochondrial import inner membrane translocase subunit tim-21 [Pestalotiopsis fici W106-1]|uniref:Mitochondrial import inner membrane translocase subunit Tim21 n=1 Tax=Pestalotiopsis fici (strain W106-1 / CGMCC3.15140) TaxID=1229662 RepID=W3XB23_PESFW|nr:Mitochondrial import inner membrane translocase subunit tim-21 [Pestalotiopsis fici W106-1]ETS83278.1 Mitochondrial import inner membrane translocase subunit tim-21 [Pestalotiopsis fici W106-1]
MKLILRPTAISSSCSTATATAALLSRSRPLHFQRSYATQNNPGSTSKRRSVTPFNDDGHVPWQDLSGAEKTARATQQTFNFGLVVVGAVLTGGVAYFLYTDVFSPDSKTAYFNRAVDRIKKDPDCLTLLGDAKKLTAHGEETYNKWRRARPIASSHTTDNQGTEHIMLHFYMEGPRNRATVNVHLTKRAGASEFEYKYFYLDIPGHQRIWLENADSKSSSTSKKYKFLGVNWN